MIRFVKGNLLGSDAQVLVKSDRQYIDMVVEHLKEGYTTNA